MAKIISILGNDDGNHKGTSDLTREEGFLKLMNKVFLIGKNREIKGLNILIRIIFIFFSIMFLAISLHIGGVKTKDYNHLEHLYFECLQNLSRSECIIILE